MSGDGGSGAWPGDEAREEERLEKWGEVAEGRKYTCMFITQLTQNQGFLYILIHD